MISTYAKASVDDVASSGIEPESGASETLILSIVRRGPVLSQEVGVRSQ